MQISLTRPSDKDRPVRAAWGRGKVAWGGVGLSRVEYHGTDAQASLGRVGPVRAAWGRGKVAWGGVGLSRAEYHGTDAEASLTSGRRPSGVGGYERPNESVVQQRKTLSEIMAKVKERKRGDSVSAAGTPAQGTPGEKKEEKKPVAKKMPEDIKKKQQMMKEYGEKQELLKKKLEEAKASAESIGRQRPSEPEGEPRKKMTAEKISQKESEDDERNLENVDKKWLKKQYSDRGCFWCKQPGHRAEECKLMWQKVRELKAKEPTEMLASRNIFCQWCFWYTTGLQGRKDRPYAGARAESRNERMDEG